VISMKNLFGILCILGGVWAPTCRIINIETGDVRDYHSDTEINLRDLHATIAQQNPSIMCDGLIQNARLMTLGPGWKFLEQHDEIGNVIGLVTHVDMITLPMCPILHKHNVRCEISLSYPDISSEAYIRNEAKRFYDSWLRNNTPKIMFSLIMGSNLDLLAAITPYIDQINFSCEKDNSKLTIIYNQSVLNPLNEQRYTPVTILEKIYYHIYRGNPLSAITQATLDLNNDARGAWIIAPLAH
jgi:hypothetical protein